MGQGEEKSGKPAFMASTTACNLVGRVFMPSELRFAAMPPLALLLAPVESSPIDCHRAPVRLKILPGAPLGIEAVIYSPVDGTAATEPRGGDSCGGVTS